MITSKWENSSLKISKDLALQKTGLNTAMVPPASPLKRCSPADEHSAGVIS